MSSLSVVQKPKKGGLNERKKKEFLVGRRELQEICMAKGIPGPETRVQVAGTRNLGCEKDKQAGDRNKTLV